MPSNRKEKSKKKNNKKAPKPVGYRKVKRVKRRETFGLYIYKLLKNIHADLGISKTAMSVMNSFVNDIFERLSTEASRLVVLNGKSTLTSSELQTAVRLLLPNELGRLAVNEAIKAMALYSNSSS